MLFKLISIFLLVGLAHGVTLKYLGCYDDNFDDRDLGNLNEDELQTVEKCVALCASSGYPYAGLQDGYYCNCGQQFGKFGKLDSNECHSACSGDSTEICGGQSKNSVYETGVKVIKKALPTNYIGCYQDGKDSKDLSHNFHSEKQTIRECVNKCQSLGYPYAGLQSAHDCNCGNFYGKYGIRSNRDCDNNCPGDFTENCGGTERNSVFRTNVPPKRLAFARRYIGCFEDRDEDRDLTADFDSQDDQTVEQCIDFCKSHGYSYAGLQKGTECYCDNAYGRFGKLDNVECDWNCAGNSTQLCGGYFRNSLYRTA